jgi:uracil-DNA glycosylase
VHPEQQRFHNPLHEDLNRIVPHDLYPEGVVPVDGDRISGTAFFPGGSGLYMVDRAPDQIEFPFGGAMILGHNFDSCKNFKESRSKGTENVRTGTWSGILRRLNAAEVPVEQCFFTNAFMGLCNSEDNRDYRGRTNQPFRDACLSFLRHQIEYQKPSMIVTLGVYVPPLLAELSPHLEIWKRPRQSDPAIRCKDMNTHPLLRAVGIHVSDGSEHCTTVVPIVHPSRPVNAKYRTAGETGEIETIRQAWQTCKAPC